MATLPLTLSLFTLPKPRLSLSSSSSSMSSSSASFRPQLRRRSKDSAIVSFAYTAGPPTDPIVTENDPKVDVSSSRGESVESPRNAISWGLLSSLLSHHKLRIAVSIFTLVGCTTCTLSMPLYSGKFFEVLIGKAPEPLWNVLSKVAVLYALEPIFTVIFVINLNTVWEKVMSNVRAQIFHRVLIQKVEFFDRYKVGELTALITSDLGSLKDIVSENISRDRGFRALSEVVGTICILFTLSPELAPLLGLLMLMVSVLVAIYKRSTVPIFKAHGMAQALIADCVNETFSAIRTHLVLRWKDGSMLGCTCNDKISMIHTAGKILYGEKRQMSMFGNQVLAYQTSGIKLGTFKSINESLTELQFIFLCWPCIGELSAGIVVSFIGYTFTLTFAVQGLVNTFGDLRGAFAAAERINSVLAGAEIDEALAYGLERDIKRQEVHDKNFGLFFVSDSDRNNQSLNMHYMSALKSTSSLGTLAWSGDLCLEDVHFSYPLRPDVEILNGLNLMLKCGTVTALVGPSGAGKSTIVQLLARFYEPTKGYVTVGGEDVRTFDKSEWARVVSIVNQEPVLFSVSVGENIAYGLPDDYVSKDDVIKAAKAANAHGFIISLPQGYDTLVGERGGLLSGGQRQRVAIARALLKNAPILILDEATSALDAVSERLVQEALNHLMKGRTTLVIAHRLSTVQNADQIALCSDGKITELGTHLELLGRKGQYASLVATQRLAFE
ncbi:ABC transporter B family member 28 [Camellia lanceoleosa]|uniref:ABC transporter B family member 28 n=1 Tax=Camellia lanceoleosa TaxID=1840588 RepID=A0ACC0H737_9ERIC|nr:ABC transporter B family member 28 [Camellia lanceoleosa]